MQLLTEKLTRCLFLTFPSLQCSFLPKFSIHIETKYEDNKGNNDNVSKAPSAVPLEVNRRNKAASKRKRIEFRFSFHVPLPFCALCCLLCCLILLLLVFSPKSKIMNSLCQRVIASLCAKDIRRIISHSAVLISSGSDCDC